MGAQRRLRRLDRPGCFRGFASRLKTVERRIAEVKREREMDRRQGEILGEEQAFDERDRRLATSPTSGPSQPRDALLPPTDQSEPIFPLIFGQVQGNPHPPATRDGHTQVGAGTVPGPAGDDELSALLRQQKELEAMSKELGSRAGELEQRARELK